MLSFLKNWFKAYQNAKLLEELETLKNDFAQLRTHILTVENEMYDTILARLEKLNKANEQRLKREKEKEKDIKEENLTPVSFSGWYGSPK